MDIENTKAFIEEREKRLGAKLKWRSYSTWYAHLDGEKREYGIFLYTDGKTIVIEDFERAPTLMGIIVPSMAKKEEYKKYEIEIDVMSICAVETVTRSSAESSIRNHKDRSKVANLFDRIFRKLVTRVKTVDGEVYFMEILNTKEFARKIEEFQKENNNGSI